ncbi:phosphoglucomutase/phosphomannomutase PgmG [Novosphingobium mangrovi (ex Hu et al. 2023)]|uniref:Phosphomannomutase/phosphoglucomutase n=1 Tax=Novosphingobium mangrovi (ex Hu et al. 2023) TaxID=2930094 RepID=A0ABT0ADL3_9SPHN|nr:phosphomannomutase/phosphoglucomutase [Novosphingobium mangrovi (ex Hu et al. 2023)]MCJ1961288.1 phosphomannomutase/phosphoglucomutase [Novosphingobium mangrovi (ex Hu et al. 2023)]
MPPAPGPLHPRGGHVFDASLLRAYDVRGIYGATLFEADAYALGRSFGSVVRRGSPVEIPKVVVGRDGRLSSPQLEQALVEGLCESGVAVIRIGLAPSPMLYFAERSLEDVEGGIEVTGSHNPADHNGFKIVLGGRPFFGADLAQLGGMAARADWMEGVGAVEGRDVSSDYIAALRGGLGQTDPDALARLRVAWDVGNGAAGPLVERLCLQLPGTHHVLHSCVDGRFPNHHPDPTLPENLTDLQALVAAKSLDFGVAFDGDADRIGVVDGQGRIVWGDQLLALLARDILAQSRGKGADVRPSVVGDVKMSATTFAQIEAAGGVPVMAPSGHSHIKSTMKTTGAILGGEMSGHLFFADRYFGFDDGIYAAVRMMALVAQGGRSVADLLDSLPRTFATPELRFTVPPARRTAVVAEVGARLAQAGHAPVTLDGLRLDGPDGWWLLRASNTQDMLTARAESTSEEGLARLVAQIDAQLALSGIIRPREA